MTPFVVLELTNKLRPLMQANHIGAIATLRSSDRINPKELRVRVKRGEYEPQLLIETFVPNVRQTLYLMFSAHDQYAITTVREMVRRIRKYGNLEGRKYL